MSQTRSTIADMLTKAALAALVATLPVTLIAQQTPAAKPAPAPVASTAAQPESEAKDAASGSIRVHGHWVMDVKDKDGRIVDHRDFQNSLTPSGPFALASLLTGYSTPGGFAVSMLSADGSTGGVTSSASTAATYPICTASPATFCSTNLTQTVVGSTIVLQGSFVAGVAFSVAKVNTTQTSCNSYPPNSTTLVPVSPAACSNGFQPTASVSGGANPFSGTTLQNPLALAAGQTLAVTVTLSFS